MPVAGTAGRASAWLFAGPADRSQPVRADRDRGANHPHDRRCARSRGVDGSTQGRQPAVRVPPRRAAAGAGKLCPAGRNLCHQRHRIDQPDGGGARRRDQRGGGDGHHRQGLSQPRDRAGLCRGRSAGGPRSLQRQQGGHGSGCGIVAQQLFCPRSPGRSRRGNRLCPRRQCDWRGRLVSGSDRARSGADTGGKRTSGAAQSASPAALAACA